MGIAQDLQRWQRMLLVGVTVALVLAAVVTYGLISQMRAASQAVSYDHAERVIEADGLETALFERSAHSRGYLLSGDPLFLENRAAASVELTTHLDRLGARGVAYALDDVRELLGRLDTASDRAIGRYPTSATEAREIWEREARPVQQQLAGRLGELASLERASFAVARREAENAGRRSTTLLTILLGSVAVLVTLMFYGYARAARALLARQHAEQEQATFRLLEQVPVGIFVLAADGTPYYANQHAQKLLGRGITRASPDRLAETYHVFEAGTDRLYPNDRLPVVRALAGEITECTDIEIHRGDEIVPLHVVGAPVLDGRGELLYAVAGFQDIRELQRVSMRDALTGLANRAAISQIYARERAVSVRAKRHLAIALIDLDRFKAINDTHGHACGDQVLQRTAATVVASLRRSDAVGRWGGEELVVMLPSTELAGAGAALEKTLGEVRALRFVGKDGAPFSVTFSAGVVVATASESLDDVIARADVLLYQAKDAGRDRVHIGPRD